jgi:predicted HTH transcriptional regulator
MVHNDYSREIPPKFEIFSDRIEITSAGSLPEGIGEEDFFDGVSVPKNKELMRIFRDLELVEQLGSGIPRILHAYGKESFRFMDNFMRISFPVDKEVQSALEEQARYQVTPQVKDLLKVMTCEHTRRELQEMLQLTGREYFRKEYLIKAINGGFVALTVPDKPNSSKQKYRLTQKGENFKKVLSDEGIQF